MRADTVSLIDKLAREHRLKKKEYLALLENASVGEHVHAAMLADKERRRIYGTEVFIRGADRGRKHLQKQLLLLRDQSIKRQMCTVYAHR